MEIRRRLKKLADTDEDSDRQRRWYRTQAKKISELRSVALICQAATRRTFVAYLVGHACEYYDKEGELLGIIRYNDIGDTEIPRFPEYWVPSSPNPSKTRNRRRMEVDSEYDDPDMSIDVSQDSGYDEDAINDAFEGDPLNTWNVD